MAAAAGRASAVSVPILSFGVAALWLLLADVLFVVAVWLLADVLVAAADAQAPSIVCSVVVSDFRCHTALTDDPNQSNLEIAPRRR